MVSIGGVEVRGVHAEHDGSRGPLGASGELGYVLTGSRSVYFAGDTDLFDGMGDLPSLDVALLPVSGWGSKVGPGHLDPERAVEALSLIRPRIAIPIHWGTYSTYGKTADREPADRFAALAAERVPDVQIRVLELGATLEVE